MPTLKFNNETVHVPEYSVYSGEFKEYRTQPFRIEEGVYAGTVFVYNDITISESGLDEPIMTFSADVLRLVVGGKDNHQLTKSERTDLYENNIGAILSYILHEHYKND